MSNIFSDIGWFAAEAARLAGSAYVAITNTRAATDIAEKENVIATGYIGLSNELRAIWKDVYLENERKLTYDLFNEAKPTPNYTLWAGTGITVSAGQFTEARARLGKVLPRFCTGGTQARLIELDFAESTVRGDAITYGMRFADSRTIALNDRQYGRRHAALMLGRGLGAQAESYSKAAAGLFGELGKQAAAGASGALGALGYFTTRNTSPTQAEPVSDGSREAPMIQGDGDA